MNMREYCLDELFDLQMGKTPSRNNSAYWNDGSNDWISIGDLSGFGKYVGETKEQLTDLAVSESGIKSIPVDTVVMSFKLSIGKLAITTEEIYSNEAIMAFIDKKVEKISPDYLYYLLLSKDWDEGTNKAVMGKTLNKATLSKVKIKLHEFSEQKEIVVVLDKANKLIILRNQQLEDLDNLIKSRFVEMFGDPQRNPFKWLKAPMGDFMITLTDFSANGSYEYLDSNVVMYDAPNYALMVRTTDLEKQNFENDVKYIDENAYNILEKSKIFGNEIIMNKIGSAGKVYLMPCLNRPVSLGRNAFMFRYDNSINVLFMYNLLISEYGTKEIMQHVRGAVTKTITKDAARSVKIIVPPIELQNQFATFVQQVDKLKVEVKRALDETQILFDSLMHQYFE